MLDSFFFRIPLKKRVGRAQLEGTFHTLRVGVRMRVRQQSEE